MASQTSTVLGIVGSLREGSFNARLLARATALAPGGVRVETFGKLGEIPHFSQDLEAETPPAVTELRAAIESAGALLIATPEYNSAMPGVLKNALELCAFVTELVDHAGGLPAEESLEAFYSRECQQIAS